MKLVAKKPQGIAGLAVLAPVLALVLALGARPAEASPPSLRGAPLTRATAETIPRSSGAVRNERESGRLDLRAPSDFSAARAAPDSASEPFASGSVPFPSARRASNSEPI